jgi:ABC-2 type transport system permease protein
MAQLAYQQRIRAYHSRLRAFFYGYLFGETPFHPDDLESVPRFDPASG